MAAKKTSRAKTRRGPRRDPWLAETVQAEADAGRPERLAKVEALEVEFRQDSLQLGAYGDGVRPDVDGQIADVLRALHLGVADEGLAKLATTARRYLKTKGQEAFPATASEDMRRLLAHLLPQFPKRRSERPEDAGDRKNPWVQLAMGLFMHETPRFKKTARYAPEFFGPAVAMWEAAGVLYGPGSEDETPGWRERQKKAVLREGLRAFGFDAEWLDNTREVTERRRKR